MVVSGLDSSVSCIEKIDMRVGACQKAVEFPNNSKLRRQAAKFPRSVDYIVSFGPLCTKKKAEKISKAAQ